MPVWKEPLSKRAVIFSAHLARAPSGSARLMCACGPNSESRWAETSCCLSWAACWARTTGVSRSSALLSFVAVWKQNGRWGSHHTATTKHGLIKHANSWEWWEVTFNGSSWKWGKYAKTHLNTQPSTHLDGIDFLSELLDFVHQTLVLLLWRLLHSTTFSKLDGVKGNGLNITHILINCAISLKLMYLQFHSPLTRSQPFCSDWCGLRSLEIRGHVLEVLGDSTN